MPNTYKLICDHISRDTVEALTQLLDLAKHGEVTGIAFGAFLKNRRYITDVAGTCLHNATTARGMVCALDDELSELVRQRDPDHSR